MSTICHVLLGQQVFSNWSGKTNRAALQPVQVLLPVSPPMTPTLPLFEAQTFTGQSESA